MEKYAMIKTNVLVKDNCKVQKTLEVVSGEVVKVIQQKGTVAIIRPYNKKSLYMIHTNYLNFDISQTESDFYVSFGVRKLKS